MPRFVKTLLGTPVPRVWGIGGTDLGIWFDMGMNEVGFLIGDTFEGGMPGSPGRWFSPGMCVSRTRNLGAGITFNRAITDQPGRAKELVPNAHQRDYEGEVTKIPNDAFRVGDRLYLSVMSVNNWANGTWETNYAELYSSDDRGRTWDVAGRRWANTRDHRNVWQMQSWVVDGQFAYLFGTSNGRHLTDGLYLARVRLDRLEDPTAYEYWGEYPAPWWAFWQGSQWRWGQHTSPILRGRFGEPSVRKIDGVWVLSIFEDGALWTRTAPAPDAPWSPRKYQLGQAEVPRLYGGFIHPWSRLDDLHLSVSRWTDRDYCIDQWQTTV